MNHDNEPQKYISDLVTANRASNSPFGDYHSEFIARISQRNWYSLSSKQQEFAKKLWNKI